MHRRAKFVLVSIIVVAVAGVGVAAYLSRLHPIEQAFKRLGVEYRSWSESRLIDPSFFAAASLTSEQERLLLDDLEIQKRWEAIELEPSVLQEIDKAPSWWTPTWKNSRCFESLPEKGCRWKLIIEDGQVWFVEDRW